MAAPPTSYADEAFGPSGASGATAPQAASNAPPFEGYKDPKTEGWAEWFGKNITGREDPRYKGIPSFEDAMLAENSEGTLKGVRAAAPFVSSDAGMANIAQKSLGDRFIRQEKDAYGVPVVVYRGPDGKEAKAYINKPGLDTEDIGRGIMQAIPYGLAAMGIGAPLGGAGVTLNAMGQAGAASTTSLATDIIGSMQGSGEGLDAKKATVTGLLAGATPVLGAALSPLIRRFWAEPALFNKTTGQLTAKGEAAAREAGLDTSALTRDLSEAFAKEFSRTGNAPLAGRSITTREFDIPVTRAQLSKDPASLLDEKAMRYGVYGESAKDTMQTFDRTQADKVAAAVVGGPDAKKSVAMAINPQRAGTFSRPADLGEAIKGGMQDARGLARQAEKEAWGEVGTLTPKTEALADIAPSVSSKLGPLRVDDKLTPKAYAMAEDLDAFIKGDVPKQGPSVLNRPPIADVGDMRKRLLATYRGASDPQDAAAAKAIYDGFNDWIESAAQRSLLNGDPASAAAMRTARDVTKEMQGIFGSRGIDGPSAGRNLMQSVLKEDATPETIVSRLFSVNPGATPKAGTQEALSLIKSGAEKYLPPERATQLWNDVRLAYWQNIVQDSTGKIHTPTMLAKRIDQAMQSQSSVVRQLYSKDEISLMRRVGHAMREISYKDPNPSGSGTAAAFYAGQFGRAVFRMVGATDGIMGKIFSAIMTATPIKNTLGSIAAQSATRGASVVPEQWAMPPALAATYGARNPDDVTSGLANGFRTIMAPRRQ